MGIQALLVETPKVHGPESFSELNLPPQQLEGVEPGRLVGAPGLQLLAGSFPPPELRTRLFFLECFPPNFTVGFLI